MKLAKIDKTLLNKVSTLSKSEQIECIIRAKDVKKLEKSLEGKQIEVLHEYLFINSLRLRLTKKQMFGLTNLNNVINIYSQVTASALINVSKKVLGVSSSSLNGQGVTVAFIDTGISSHADFLIGKKRIKFFKDFVGNKEAYYDDNGHGTFVCGVCSGSGALSGGKFSGIAPCSEVVVLKALDSSGQASADKILDAMEWIYQNHKKFNIKVVCMSFGSEPLGINDPIMSGADALWQEGVCVVAAAGNSGPDYQTIKSPGVSSQIITVGGFDDNRIDENFYENFFEIAPFSSRGPAFRRFKPDLVAPSVNITSCGIKDFYTTLSGTSTATPMIAGLACLLLQKEPNITPNQIKSILLSRCKPISLNRNLEGFGYPNFDGI